MTNEKKNYLDFLRKMVVYFKHNKFNKTWLCNEFDLFRDLLEIKYESFYKNDSDNSLNASVYFSDLLSGRAVIRWITNYCNNHILTTYGMMRLLNNCKKLDKLDYLYQIKIDPKNGYLANVQLAERSTVVNRIQSLYSNNSNQSRQQWVQYKVDSFRTAQKISVDCVILAEVIKPHTSISGNECASLEEMLYNSKKLDMERMDTSDSELNGYISCVKEIIKDIYMQSPSGKILEEMLAQLRWNLAHAKVRSRVLQQSIISKIINK